MLRAAITFFALAIIAMFLGMSGIAGVSMEIGRTLLFVFLILAVVAFVINLISGRKTNINMLWLGLIPLLGMTQGCAGTKRATDKALSQPTAQTSRAAHDAGASDVIEVNFDKGSSVLNDGSRDAIRDLVNKAEATGQFDDLKIIAWSDNNYPGERGELSQEDQTLAQRRADAIKNFAASELNLKNIKVYNMAEGPNALQRMFNTSDAKVKRALENSGVTSADGKIIAGNASHALVMTGTRQ